MSALKIVLLSLTIVMLLAQTVDEDLVEYMRDLLEFRQGFAEALHKVTEFLRSRPASRARDKLGTLKDALTQSKSKSGFLRMYMIRSCCGTVISAGRAPGF